MTLNHFFLASNGEDVFPLPFLLCAEILGSVVRRDDEVKGIQIYDTECKVSQYADDNSNNFIYTALISPELMALYNV